MHVLMPDISEQQRAANFGSVPRYHSQAPVPPRRPGIQTPPRAAPTELPERTQFKPGPQTKHEHFIVLQQTQFDAGRDTDPEYWTACTAPHGDGLQM